jgi:carotenoid cleavage dioxygenase-like enzyme
VLTRRRFLEVSAALSAGAALGCRTEEGPIGPMDSPVYPASIVKGSREEWEDDLQLVAGRMPADLEGHAFVVGAVPYGDGTPLFTGDGMVYRTSFPGGKARMKTRLVRTDDFLVDEATTGMSMGFSNNGFIRMSSAFGVRDFANTALVPFADGRLLATFDAGRPWEIDPLTLDPVTPVGLQSSWREFIPAIVPGLKFFSLQMSTAHPAWDKDDGKLYAVNYATPIPGLGVNGFLDVVVWDGAGEPRRVSIVDASGNPAVLTQSAHQMQVTRNWVLISDGAFVIEAIGSNDIRPQLDKTILWAVRKSDLGGASARGIKIEIPMESAHFLAAREDDGDRVTVMLPHQVAADPSEWVRADDVELLSGKPVSPGLVGMMVSPTDLSPHGTYVIDLNSGAVIPGQTRLVSDERLWGAALWAQDERARAGLGHAWWMSMGFAPEVLTKRVAEAYRDHAYRHIPLGELPREGRPGHLYRIDHDTQKIHDAYPMPRGWVPMSPTFVPRKGAGANDGYIVLFVVGPSDEVWIFDAGDLARGPLCRLNHPKLDFGFSLHTAWLPGLERPAPAYKVDRRQDYGDRLKEIPAEAQPIATRILGL